MRIRPIISFNGRKEECPVAIKRIFNRVFLEISMIGTLRLMKVFIT